MFSGDDAFPFPWLEETIDFGVFNTEKWFIDLLYCNSIGNTCIDQNYAIVNINTFTSYFNLGCGCYLHTVYTTYLTFKL